jgi:molecular chaperone HtpG
VTSTNFPSFAENKAAEAHSLRAFQSFNLLKVRTSTAQLLAQIGKNGLFEQYTLHDISHIDKMLGMMEWLIPQITQQIMTPADWLMIVLGVYFHDLGMIVTRKEFDSRRTSDFKNFREEVYRGEQGEDYRRKIEGFRAEDEAERFLYQEFVRHNHAKRIKLWIIGQNSAEFGVADDAAREVRELVKPLGERFCRDLALVCESHHLDDLYDLKKYKPNQPYGDDDREAANLQYSAILLRTADLLHVTQDRTPSLTFRVISPTDPVSIEEWLKQMAVVAVKSKVARDQDGQANKSLPRDTILVDAYFTNPGGFFALTRYLQYVRAELRQCHDWAKLGIRETGSKYEFPWRHLDDSSIETRGFLNKQFEFTLDQAKILDLLTGHTLYNDIKVVLRELAQNSIDAVRLRTLESGKRGSIHVRWHTSSRVLSVEDTGTGMSQLIIENHLLKVGSSRYQDQEFQKTHPEFNPISRFGIGVLSTFMIANEVEIITSHIDDEQARQLSLRSVHGRYLVKLLDKAELPEPLKSCGEGTIIRLTVRPSIRMPDVLETAKLWVVFPPCDVLVSVDDGPPTKIGFDSPKDAAQSYFDALNLSEREGTQIKFEETQIDGITVGYALGWEEFFQEWSFIRAKREDSTDDDAIPPPLGICVEGIRVTFGTPGFEGHPIVAVANATGANAPKTNVARSGLESTPQRDRALATIYRALANHVTKEIDELHGTRSFSLTWAVQEAAVLAEPLWARDKSRPDDAGLLVGELARIPSLIVEEAGQRKAVSPASLSTCPRIWTIDCALFNSAETLLRELPGATSLSALSSFLLGGKLQLQPDPILCGFAPHSELHRTTLHGREVSEIVVHRTQRRVDLLWCTKGATPRWVTLRELVDDETTGRRRTSALRLGLSDVSIALGEIQFHGDITGIDGVRAFGMSYFQYASPPARCVRHYLAQDIPKQQTTAAIMLIARLLITLGRGHRTRTVPGRELVSRELEPRFLGIAPSKEEIGDMDIEPIISMCDEALVVFDPSDWRRKDDD